MKTSFLSILAAASLMASTAIAATATHTAATVLQNPYDRLNDRNDRDFNYGFDKKHRVTPDERKRWEEAHRNDRKDDKHDRKEERKYDKRDDRNDKDFNYGFDKKHRVTNEERARWEAAHRNDGRR